MADWLIGVLGGAPPHAPTLSVARLPGAPVSPESPASPAGASQWQSVKFPAKTPVRAKPDGLTPVALRAKRPLIAPSRPSSSPTLCGTSSGFAVGPIGHIGPLGRRLRRSLTAPSIVAPQGRSVLRSRGRFGASRLHAPFSVLRARKRPSPARAWGSAPQPPITNFLISQSPNQLISQFPFVVLCVLRDSRAA